MVFDAASVAAGDRKALARRRRHQSHLYSATKRELLQKVVARWYESLIAEIERGLAERVSASG